MTSCTENWQPIVGSHSHCHKVQISYIHSKEHLTLVKDINSFSYSKDSTKTLIYTELFKIILLSNVNALACSFMTQGLKFCEGLF